MRHSETVRPGSAGGANATHRHSVVASSPRPPADVQYQTTVKNFEIGVRAFQKQNYDKAAEIFEKLLNNDARDVAERARMHLRLCRQKTARPAPQPKSAEDQYALGIACLNAREFTQAVEHLSKADKIKPHQEHVQYALAASHALAGNADAAFAHLEVAVTLRPDNRMHARRDEDFKVLSADPRFQALIYQSISQDVSRDAR